MPLIAALLACEADPIGVRPDLPPPAPVQACDRWSDPATWGDAPPAEGACVTIPADRCVLLDVDGLHLASLDVEGKLAFDDRDLTLTADWITVTGALEVGTADQPFLHRATIELVDDHAVRVAADPGSAPSPGGFAWATGCGDSVVRQPLPPASLHVTGPASLDLHGEPVGPTWVRLAEPAEAGDRALVLDQPVPWRAGDRLVIASTDFDMNLAEEVTIEAVDGARVTLTDHLANPHWSGLARENLGPPLPRSSASEDRFRSTAAASRTSLGGLAMRAEVARLTRNVRVVGARPTPVALAGSCALPTCTCTYQDCFCPVERPEDLAFAGGEVHVSASVDGAPAVRVEDVALEGLGRYGELGHYPLHFHELAHPPELRVRRNVVHRSSNRAIVVHGTSGALLEDNVAWDVVGSAFYLERSTLGHRTHENHLEHNLAGSVRGCNPLDEGKDKDGPGSFWAADPENTWVGNVSAGSDYAGFYLDHREYDPCDALGDPPICERGRFEGNTAHSSPNGFYANERRYTTDVHVDSTAWKIAGRAFWLRNRGTTELVRPRTAESGTGLYLASFGWFDEDIPSFHVRDALILGETANRGVPRTEDELAYGRTLPLFDDLLGVEVYEGRALFEGATFAGFPEERQVGARTLRSAAFGGQRDFFFYDNDPLNAVRDLTFVDAWPLWFPEPVRGATSTSTAALLDLDGSLWGTPGAWFVADDRFHLDRERTHRRPHLGAIEVPPEVGLVQLVAEWIEPEVPVPQTFGRVRSVAYDRIEGGEVVETLLADLSKDGNHRRQAVTLLAGTEVALHYLDGDDDEVAGFDEVKLSLRSGRPGSSVLVHVPLEHPDWAGSVSRGAAAVDPADYTFDPATTVLSTTLTLGGAGDSPMDGEEDEVQVLP